MVFFMSDFKDSCANALLGGSTGAAIGAFGGPIGSFIGLFSD